MRSNVLLLILISTISAIKEESKESIDERKDVTYGGPIVYSDEKPPIIVFPTPASTPSSDAKTGQQNVSLKNANIEYVPFPYQELPVLIYKSKDNPPIHMVSQSLSNDGSNNSLSNIDKRLGETTSTGSQRGGRALKWSNFKLFNDKPVVMKTQKRGPTDNSGLNLLSTHMLNMNNTSLMSSVNSPLSLASAPHVVYSGHPPIHVFPQPIIIKEPEFSEMASASEPFHSMKNPVSGNAYDLPMSPSNKHEVSTSPASTQFYSYSGTPLGSGNSKSYGFRVKTRGNKQDTDYSSSNNYENYDDSYSPQHSDGSSESQTDETKFKPSSHYSNSVASDVNSEREYDREYDRPVDTYPREKSREKYPKFSSNNWLDWDADNGWLSSLFGYNRYPTRPRRPMALSLVNSPTNEQLIFAASQANPLDIENLALMNPHLRHNGWVTGMNPMRPTASAIRPVYSLGNFFNYRRPPMPPPPTPFYARFNPGMIPGATNVPPVPMKPLGLMPPIMSLPSVSYPVRIPVSPLMMYGFRRPTLGPTGDLAFAESTRNTTNTVSKKWANIHDDIQMSGSHPQPTYVLPSVKPTGATVQNKPPIIIYQGLRPPVHVYKQPNLTVGHNSEVQHNSLMAALQQIQDNREPIFDQSSDETTTVNPYYQFFTTEDSMQSFGNNYKSGSTLYIGESSAFSPRHSSGDWIPVKQHINGSKDSELNI